MTTVIPELAGIAALMAIVIARLVKWSAEARNRTQAAVDLFLLGMMAAMFLGAAIYFQAPGPGTLVEGLWVSGALMSVSVSPVFLDRSSTKHDRTSRKEIATCPGRWPTAERSWRRSSVSS